MTDPLTDLRFWAQVIEDARRTIVCSPDAESRIKSGLQARGLDGLNKVVVSTICPDGTAYVINEQLLTASLNQAMHSWGRTEPADKETR